MSALFERNLRVPLDYFANQVLKRSVSSSRLSAQKSMSYFRAV